MGPVEQAFRTQLRAPSTLRTIGRGAPFVLRAIGHSGIVIELGAKDADQRVLDVSRVDPWLPARECRLGEVGRGAQRERRAGDPRRPPQGLLLPRHCELDRRALARFRHGRRGSRPASPSDETLTTLRDAYDQLGRLLPEVEPFEALERAEAHRAFWRPPTVSVVLLAESHVFTGAADLERRIVRLPGAPVGIPPGFVRLVYCLGYGENDILDRRISEPPNAGTPQFWRIFASCIDGSQRSADFRANLGSSVPSHVRVANKMALLGRLRDAGVWLLDASPAALYGPGGSKPSSRVIDQAIDLGYELHVRYAIEAARPSEIICVGKGVGDVLAARLRRIGATITVVSQPNARVTTAQHDLAFATYWDVVRRATRIQSERATPC